MDAALWRDLFHPDVSILEKLIRPILVYAFLIAGLRLAGKRELAQLNAFDLVVLLTLSNTVQNAIIGNDNSVSGGSSAPRLCWSLTTSLSGSSIFTNRWTA